MRQQGFGRAALLACGFYSALAAAANVNSAEASELSAAVVSAVQWHPRVQSAVARLQQANAEIGVARAGYFPQLRAGVSSGYSDREANRNNQTYGERVVVSASQMLYDFGKTASGVDRAKALHSAAEAQLLLAVDLLAQETAQAWIEVHRYQQLVQMADEQVRSVNAIGQLARERRAQGASTLSDETQVRAREDAALASRLQQQAQLRRFRTQLMHLTGQPVQVASESSTPVPLSQACLNFPNSQQLPSIRVAEAEQSVAKAELAGAARRNLPTLSLEGGYNEGLNSASREGAPEETYMVVDFSAPLYQGGGSRAAKRAAHHALEVADNSLRYARLVAEQSWQDASEQAQGYQQRVAVLATRTRNIHQTRDLYRQQYLDLGTRSLLDLLNAEQEFHQARFDSVNNQHDLYRLQIDCLYQGGQLREAFALNGINVAGVELQP